MGQLAPASYFQDVFIPVEWIEHAACHGYPRPADFFPTGRYNDPRRKAAEKRALGICAECTVTSQCLWYARKTESVGVWGGTTEEQRFGRRLK